MSISAHPTPSVGLPQSDHDRLYTAVAAELRLITPVLEQLGMTLVEDEHFVSHYLEQLQAFDLLAQQIEACAEVLDRLASGARSQEAIAKVRLVQVHERLLAALAH